MSGLRAWGYAMKTCRYSCNSEKSSTGSTEQDQLMGTNKSLNNASRASSPFLLAMAMLCAIGFFYLQRKHTSQDVPVPLGPHAMAAAGLESMPSPHQTSEQAAQKPQQQKVEQQQTPPQQQQQQGLQQQQEKGQDGTLQHTTAGKSTLVSLTTPSTARKPGTQQPVPLKPTCEVLEATEVVYQVPPDPIGVLFVAHGCHHGAVDWWPVSKHCPACLGLPHEVAITRDALARGYAVVAISSVDREESRCWMSSSPVLSQFTSEDVKMVKGVLSTLLPRLQLTHLPLYALGVSSGGEFVITLAMGNGLQLAGVCSQVMAVPSHWFEKYLAAVKEGKAVEGVQLKPLPPIMFVHMPRDEMTATTIAADMAVLNKHGVPCHEHPIQPAPLTPTTLHTAIPDEITARQSEAIFKVFKDNTYLDEAGLLLTNPRVSGWRKDIIKAQVPEVRQMRLEDDESPMAEILNGLFAGHEVVSASTNTMLDWFESHRAAA